MGSVALALRARAQARDQGAKSEVVEWDRVVVGNLIVLSLWCWGSPSSVKEVLDEGGALGVVCTSLLSLFDVMLTLLYLTRKVGGADHTDV